MKRTFLMSAAAAALIAGSGFAVAQGNSDRNNPRSPEPAAQQNAPAEKMAPREQKNLSGTRDSGSGMTTGQSNEDKQPKAGATTGQSSDQKGSGTAPRASDNMNNEKSKGAASDKGGVNGRTKAEGKSDGTKAGKDAAGERSTTTGQGAASGAAANLTTEQRTRIVTTFRTQKVKPVTNVNFSISVGAKVPRTVHFYPVPTTVVTIYPGWRGYEYFLVGDQIVVVNPRTLEIVAVLEA
jgi:hypothetical protein